jgi:hypothetical protein
MSDELPTVRARSRLRRGILLAVLNWQNTSQLGHWGTYWARHLPRSGRAGLFGEGSLTGTAVAKEASAAGIGSQWEMSVPGGVGDIDGRYPYPCGHASSRLLAVRADVYPVANPS